MNFLDAARAKLEQIYRYTKGNRVPAVCGLCDHCGEYEYGDATMFMCEHKGAMHPSNLPPFVTETEPPPTFCPKRNGIHETMIVSGFSTQKEF